MTETEHILRRGFLLPREPLFLLPERDVMHDRHLFVGVNDVRLAFATPRGHLLALDGVTLALSDGEFVAVVGPSGCGKTSLLRVLGGLIAPTAGEVLLRGERLSGPRPEIGLVFQQPTLMPWRTALDNVALPLELRGAAPAERRQRAAALLRRVGLAGFEHSRPRELSGGMQQRVALARALAHDPALLLLDEPFGALDALTRERLNLELLRLWQAQQRTVVLVTHSIQEAVFLADRVLVMTPRPGRICRQIVVTLPRPRGVEALSTPAFASLAHQVRRSIADDNASCGDEQ
jgi:NitT/TauT family transport system ATP-binding protein